MRLAPALVALFGCGGGGSGSEPLLLHAANAKLAVVRDGATWQPLTLDAQGTTTVALDGPTMIATVCDGDGFFNYYAVGVGPGEEDLDLSCADNVTPVATIHIAAPSTTRVAIGFSRGFGGVPLGVPHGTYDIIAVDTSLTPARIEVRRSVPVTADATLTFDLATSGVAMSKIRVDVTGLDATETPNRGTSFRTANGTSSSWFATSGTDSWIPPASVIGPLDRMSVSASTGTEHALRSASRDLAGTETATTLALPSYVTATPTLDGSIAWQGDARFDDFYFGINTPDFARLWDTLLLPTWHEAGGATSAIAIPDPTMIPGWQSAWNLDAAPGFEWTFFASHGDGADHIGASLDGSF